MSSQVVVNIEFPLQKDQNENFKLEMQLNQNIGDIKQQLSKNLKLSKSNIRIYSNIQLLEDYTQITEITKQQNNSLTEINLKSYYSRVEWEEIYPENQEFCDQLKKLYAYPEQDYQFKSLQKLNAHNSIDQMQDMLMTSFIKKSTSVNKQKPSIGMQLIDINQTGKTTTAVISMIDIYYKYLEENMICSLGDIDQEKQDYIAFFITDDKQYITNIIQKIIQEQDHKLYEHLIFIGSIQEAQDLFIKNEDLYQNTRFFGIDNIEQHNIDHQNFQNFLGDFYSSYLKYGLGISFVITGKMFSKSLKFEMQRIFQKINVNKNDFGYKSLLPNFSQYKQISTQQQLTDNIISLCKQLIQKNKDLPFLISINFQQGFQQFPTFFNTLKIKINTEVAPFFQFCDLTITLNQQELQIKKINNSNPDDIFSSMEKSGMGGSFLQDKQAQNLKSQMKNASIQINIFDIQDFQNNNQLQQDILGCFLTKEVVNSCYSCGFYNLFIVQDKENPEQYLEDFFNQLTEQYFWLKENQVFEQIIGEKYNQDKFLQQLQRIIDKNNQLYQYVSPISINNISTNFYNNTQNNQNQIQENDELDLAITKSESKVVPLSKDNSTQIIKNQTGSKNDQKMLESRINNIKSLGQKDKQNLIQKWKDNQNNNEQKAKAQEYFNVLFALPWDQIEEIDDINMEDAKYILNNKHYGMEKTKELILEYLGQFKQAKHQDNNSLDFIQKQESSNIGSTVEDYPGQPQYKKQLSCHGQGPSKNVICLVGPPGVGKTSIVKVISKCLNRDYLKISMGGVTDSSFILGHSSVYQGAKPGEIVFQLLKSKSMNPVFLLDEIDKVQSGAYQDPKAQQVLNALLELLDPMQNTTFKDHYLDVTLNLSNAFFICTANYKENIPGPLLDRMEVIECEPYKKSEKIVIAKQYVIPKIMAMNNISNNQLEISEESISYMIQNYQPNESGIRKMEEMIETIARKTSLELVQARESNRKMEKKIITIQAIQQYFGEPIKQYNVQNLIKKPGSALSVLSSQKTGGSLSLVETVLFEGSGDIICKKEIKDMVQLALGWAKSNKNTIQKYLTLEKEEQFNQLMKKQLDISVNFTPFKLPLENDGISGSLAILISLISAIVGKKVLSSICFIGEITLQGLVLATGQVKQLVLAAIDRGINKIYLSSQNENDIIRYLTNEQRAKISFQYLEDVEYIFENLNQIFENNQKQNLERSRSTSSYQFNVHQNNSNTNKDNTQPNNILLTVPSESNKLKTRK